MDALIKEIWAWLAQYGPPGFLAFVSLAAAYRFFDLYTKAQEKRIEEASKTTVVLIETREALTGQKEVLKELLSELRAQRLGK